MIAETRLALLAAGGTGGHVFPARSLAESLVARGVRVALVTDRRGGGFGEALDAQAYRISAGSPGGGPIRKALGLARLARGYVQSRRLLRRLAPSVVIGFGGYPSVPPMLAAARARLPTMIHEQNAVLGRANRLLARRVDRIATAHETGGGARRGRPPQARAHGQSGARRHRAAARRAVPHPGARGRAARAGARRQPGRAHPVRRGARRGDPPARGAARAAFHRAAMPRRGSGARARGLRRLSRQGGVRRFLRGFAGPARALPASGRARRRVDRGRARRRGPAGDPRAVRRRDGRSPGRQRARRGRARAGHG